MRVCVTHVSCKIIICHDFCIERWADKLSIHKKNTVCRKLTGFFIHRYLKSQFQGKFILPSWTPEGNSYYFFTINSNNVAFPAKIISTLPTQKKKVHGF